MSIHQLIGTIRGLFGLSELAPKSGACRSCGAPFTSNQKFLTVHAKCKRRLLSMSQKRKLKLTKRFKDNPSVCVICGGRLDLETTRPQYYVCSKCKYEGYL